MANKIPEHPPNIFLIGYRGTGKTTIGRLVAARLGWNFVDADVLLEEHFGQTIREIFASEGEAGFRRKEADIIYLICKNEQQVVATGGGVILREENRELLKNAGIVVCLSAKPETLWERIKQDATTTGRRPNLTTGGLAEIVEMLEKRSPLYEACASFTLDTNRNTPAELAQQLIVHLFPD